MGRYSGTLANLVEEAISAGKSKHASASIWNKVLAYLQNHSTTDGAIERPEFDSPLPPFSVPSEMLDEQLLERKFGPRQDNTILKLAVSAAPAPIVAALCHLQPHAAKIPDHRSKLPLHVACRRNPNDKDTQIVFDILLQVYEEAIGHRDSAGRTPLHCLFMYHHAPHRSVALVERFCQTLPVHSLDHQQPEPHKEDTDPLPEVPHPSSDNRVPSNATIVPDARHGALPLHYAVMEGASRDVLRLLLNKYPESKRLVDRKGRTALAWYLGAGHLSNPRSVTGEPQDSASFWDKNKVESATVQLLLNSSSARMADCTGRSPLHWAIATCARHVYTGHGPSVSMKTIQLLLDHHIEVLVTGDLEEKTPLHLLFDAVADVQEAQWNRLQRNKSERSNLDLVNGGPIAFSPPMELLEVLVNYSNEANHTNHHAPPTANLEERSAVFMEDVNGRLPIHAAVAVASSPSCIKYLIQANPTSLVHTTEETLVAPLHMSIMNPYVAPLQTPETMRLILRAYVASRHGTYVDGRLALKMEDADGNYPIHYACRNQVCLEVLRMLVEEYPKCALFPTADGDLPLHQLLDVNVFETAANGMPPLGASLARSKSWSSNEEKAFHQQRLSVIHQKIQLLLDPILQSKKVVQWLKTPSFVHGMLPLHIAVAWGGIPYSTIKRILDKCPETAEVYTTVEGHKYSPLELHENYKQKVCIDVENLSDEWQHIREMLFAYSPLLKGHAQLDDILAQSVQVVRAEVNPAIKGSSVHYKAQMALQRQPETPAIESSNTFSSIEVPDIDHGGRPLSKKAIERSRQVSPSKKSSRKKRAAKQPPSPTKAPKKSIYDEDALDTRYTVSDGELDHDEDEDYFSGPESVEEYLSDESDERFDSFDDEENPTGTTAKNSWETPQHRDSVVKKKNAEEEKKEGDDHAEPQQAETQQQPLTPAGPTLSEVGMRMLTFFVLYCDPKNPADNYASLVESILDEVSRVVVEQIVSLPLPSYAAQYLEEDTKLKGLTLRDVASPKCRVLIHKLFYFLGRFDFRSETGGILLQKSFDSTTVQVRSSEWTFSTEEYKEAPEIEPGVAEAQIWETGIIPAEEAGYMGATFRAMRRSICFMFTQNLQAYRNEVECRAALGVSVDGGAFSESHIVPVIAHYNTKGVDRRDDRLYKNDTNNESFVILDIFGKNGSAGETICLTDYPYALVFPYSNYGDLFDYFFRHGVKGVDETREICRQIGKALTFMHENGIIHGNVSMRNIVLFPPMVESEIEEGRKHWALTNLSGACKLSGNDAFMGKVSAQGFAEFYSSSLPPEMFVKLSKEELKQYREYWEAVERLYGCTVDRSVVDPVVDFQTGVSYVMRCHFVPDEEHASKVDEKLPPLPYKLLPAREASDVWAFGQLLFMLCSSGRPLFSTNARTSHLLNYKEICEWDINKAEGMVYEYVENPLAQDILLRLLGPYEKRSSLTMETILTHPFFNEVDASTKIAKTIKEKRSNASAAYKRWLENNVSEKSEENWLSERTVNVACWDFEFQTRIHLTPTALIPSLISSNVDHLGMPCSFITLPYKLVRNKKGVLTPPSKRDVERAERLGLHMLSLSKACHFVNVMKKIVNSPDFSARRWSSTTMLDAIDLPKEQFGELQSGLSRLAAEHVELFRSEPISVGLKLIQQKIKEYLACYDDSSKVLLYLVDEYKGAPVVNAAAAPFPHQVSSNMKQEVARRGLPFMYLCARYFRGLAGSPAGFVKLIFEAAAPYIPPSWKPVCDGLDNSLDRDLILDDIKILCDALSDLESSKTSSIIGDDFDFMQKYIAQIDPRRVYAKLRRVSSGEASVWTGKEGVEEIQEAAKGFGFKEAIEGKLKTDQKMKEQESRIKELEAELEKLKFRSTLSLQVPEEETSIPAPTPRRSNKVEAPSSDLYELGKKCIAANSDLIAEKSSPSNTVGHYGTAMEQIDNDGVEQSNSWTSYEELPDAAEELDKEPQIQKEEAPEPEQQLDEKSQEELEETFHKGESEVPEELSVGSLPDVEDKISHSQDENKEPMQEEKKPSEEGPREVNSMIDNIFEQAQLEFGDEPMSLLNERSQSNNEETPRENKGNGHGSKESREEDTHDCSTISTESQSKGDYLEISHEELTVLKNALKSGKTASASKKETLSEMFEKEMENFQSEIAGLGKTGITPNSNRASSEVSSSSAENGTVKRLANLYLSKTQKQLPNIDVNATPSSPESLTQLNTPQAGFRRSVIEGEGQE